MSARRWLDSVTSVIVWKMPNALKIYNPDEKWAVVFYGKYYTFYTDLVGEKRHICMLVSEDCLRYRWEEYNTTDVFLGQKVPWGQVPAALQDLIQDEYRKDIPGYRAKGLLQSPEKYEQNRKNYGGGRRK